MVDNRTYAPFHQHFLVARLDLDVDGDDNTVMEVDSRALPISEDNPYGLAVVTEATPVASEAESARDFNWDDAAVVEGGQPQQDQQGRHATRRTSSCPTGVDPTR